MILADAYRPKTSPNSAMIIRMFSGGLLATVLSLLVGLLCLSCSSADSERYPDVSHIEVNLQLRRLEQEMAGLKTHEQIMQFLEDNPHLAENYFERRLFPSDSALAAQIQKFLSTPENDTLRADIERIFGDFSQQIRALEEGFRHLKYYYPDFEIPPIYTISSGFTAFGFGQDIFVSKDAIVIGVDYFAGKQARFIPPGIPKYILRRYQPEYIAPTVFMFLSRVFNNYDSQDQTLLADMVFYGKSMYFTRGLLPSAADTTIIGYTAQELSDSHFNARTIWGHFIEKNLLYEKVHSVKSRYVGERPYVLEIGDKCPGRIGWWLGWQIVNRYANATESTFTQVMEKASAQEMLVRSKYKPE